jgi:hypothetical protein
VVFIDGLNLSHGGEEPFLSLNFKMCLKLKQGVHMKLLIASLTLIFSGTVFASDIQSCIVNMNRNTGLNAKDSSDFCRQVGGDTNLQSCVVNLNRNTGLNARDSVNTCLNQ